MAERGDIATRFQPGNTAGVGHGPPIGTVNNFKHGLHAATTFGVGSLPEKCNWITNRVGRVRRSLEAAVLERHGELSLKHLMLIQTACRCEVVSLLSQRWLRLREATMSHDQRLSYLNNIASASERRDKAVEKLNLDPTETASVLDALYAAPVTPLPPEAEGGSDDR